MGEQQSQAELENALKKLKATQNQLLIQEKLATIGQLSAGIAHEIQNPLNFVNNFADLTVELLKELEEDILDNESMSAEKKLEEVKMIAEDIKANSLKIAEHGRRADSIIRRLLLHSRESSDEPTPTDLNKALKENLNLAYHGMRVKMRDFNATLEEDLDPTLPMITVIPQDVSRVFLNISNNAFYAVYEKQQTAGTVYQPTVKISSRNLGNEKVELRIRDNGNGIPDNIKNSIFTPFFSTKRTGDGTGLGLAISYDVIVKEHGGELIVETEPGNFTEFIIILENKQPVDNEGDGS